MLFFLIFLVWFSVFSFVGIFKLCYNDMFVWFFLYLEVFLGLGIMFYLFFY